VSILTPISSTIGGALIGVAASMLWVFNGKIAGVSGIFGGLFAPAKEDRSWRASFVAGLLAAGVLFSYRWPRAIGDSTAHSIAAIALAGLLVGAGTEMGHGCTSGHGVCGISRGSKRSAVATATFMATGMATVFVLRHLIGGSP
jgi:uncharacterized membrane protein YedE/YeeE